VRTPPSWRQSPGHNGVTLRRCNSLQHAHLRRRRRLTTRVCSRSGTPSRSASSATAPTHPGFLERPWPARSAAEAAGQASPRSVTGTVLIPSNGPVTAARATLARERGALPPPPDHPPRVPARVPPRTRRKVRLVCGGLREVPPLRTDPANDKGRRGCIPRTGCPAHEPVGGRLVPRRRDERARARSRVRREPTCSPLTPAGGRQFIPAPGKSQLGPL
jgi:hypothetical protein